MAKTVADAMADLGPIDDWLLSVDEIERVIVRGPCEHGKPTFGDCRRCAPRELFRRQMEVLALRKGCTPEDAQIVANTAVWRTVDGLP